MESFLLYVISSPYFYKLKIDLLKSPSSANALTLADSTFVKSSLRLNAIANSCTVIKTILTLLPFANVVNASSEKPEKLMNNPLVKPDFEDTFSLKTTKSALSIFLFVKWILSLTLWGKFICRLTRRQNRKKPINRKRRHSP